MASFISVDSFLLLSWPEYNFIGSPSQSPDSRKHVGHVQHNAESVDFGSRIRETSVIILLVTYISSFQGYDQDYDVVTLTRNLYVPLQCPDFIYDCLKREMPPILIHIQISLLQDIPAIFSDWTANWGVSMTIRPIS